MIFSIGETAKLNNVTIQTLRHYDKEGLLKPSYIDENTKYRFYSIDQFLQIDFIKRCKALGFSLDKIKCLLYEENSLENILESIIFQKYMVQLQIEKLQNLKNNLEELENNLEHAIFKLDKSPDLEDISFYILGSSKGEMKNIADIETHIRKVLKSFKSPHNISDTFIVLKTNKDSPEIYTELIIASYSIKSEIKYSARGVSFYTESAAFHTKDFFEKIEDFSIENNLQTRSEYLEIAYVSKLDSKNKERSLVSIFSPIDL
ncbi:MULTISPECIES: MerR family transcriptional regulator [unclassified Cetobacterium]|uniref:MerR family transcriptional regulator n=1 Tax=unclassified Cetobacterium TaxID=2630983 RepID=UPI000690D9E1|nr:MULTISPECIES: MerR family transcriptional regulator [unclassified Cetobacterium]